MTEGPRANAWQAFWRDRPAGGRNPGCLPHDGGALATLQRTAWHGFAAALPANARTLDIGTGDGRVMHWMREVRGDLDCQGIDLSPTLPPAPPGTVSTGGIAMEHLPFPAAHFDAVTSQFALEYGDLPVAFAQVARVLRPGGSVGMLTHRADGPLLQHNLARKGAIAWAIEAKALPEAARLSLRALPPHAGAIPSAFGDAVAEAEASFGKQSPAFEIAEAIRQALARTASDGADAARGMIDRIEALAIGESGRIAALEQACRAIADEDALRETLRRVGLEQVAARPLSVAPGDGSFADFRHLVSRRG
ncbi:methyltransferase domain-containing protein [Altererythrobacter aerius]|uniref:Methyltransferase domain-containing protein n=1 Tax=Tsuneonella aeria TaxID=1837929 RepID=A0A6I4TCW7_9SPHN|nr:class I SAM-dependent methyltransferase [Tsuneonella aeria]MXO74903.1 methyltransferase domain-containing protein [Tsuneonella aeria]